MNYCKSKIIILIMKKGAMDAFETTAVMPQKNSRVQTVTGMSEDQVKIASQ
jgi:hypothetical protein